MCFRVESEVSFKFFGGILSFRAGEFFLKKFEHLQPNINIV
jgi:deoxyinosine 3'endonuclease (endonuclease V)